MDIKINKFEAPRKANPFESVIAQLADAQNGSEDILAADVPVSKETALSTAQAKIREAAREAGFRARIRGVDEANRVITVTIHERKAPASDAGSEVAESSDEG